VNFGKILKALASFITCFALTGCFWQTVDITDIMKAQQFCKDKGGIKEIDAVWTGQEHVYCVSGHINKTYKIKLEQYGALDNGS